MLFQFIVVWSAVSPPVYFSLPTQDAEEAGGL